MATLSIPPHRFQLPGRCVTQAVLDPRRLKLKRLNVALKAFQEATFRSHTYGKAATLKSTSFFRAWQAQPRRMHGKEALRRLLRTRGAFRKQRSCMETRHSCSLHGLEALQPSRSDLRERRSCKEVSPDKRKHWSRRAIYVLMAQEKVNELKRHLHCSESHRFYQVASHYSPGLPGELARLAGNPRTAISWLCT